MPNAGDVTVIVVNYRTPRLLSVVVNSFEKFYPRVRLIVVDNGSGDRSVEEIQRLQGQYCAIDSLFLERNVYHGPAVNRALDLVDTRYFFLLDTDCKIEREKFLERMSKRFFQHPKVYAVGKIRYVRSTGVPTRNQKGHVGLPYVETWGALFDKKKCAILGEFVAAGASGMEIAKAAKKRRWEVVDFPVSDYIDHLGAGTRRMFQGAWNPELRARASKWSEGARRF